MYNFQVPSLKNIKKKKLNYKLYCWSLGSVDLLLIVCLNVCWAKCLILLLMEKCIYNFLFVRNMYIAKCIHN